MHHDGKISGARIQTHDLWIQKWVCYPLHHSAPHLDILDSFRQTSMGLDKTVAWFLKAALATPHHRRFKFGSSFLRCNNIRPASSYTGKLRGSSQMFAVSSRTSCQWPVVYYWNCSGWRRPRTISCSIGLNLWRLSLCRQGANVLWTPPAVPGFVRTESFKALSVTRNHRFSLCISVSWVKSVPELLMSSTYSALSCLVIIITVSEVGRIAISSSHSEYQASMIKTFSFIYF